MTTEFGITAPRIELSAGTYMSVGTPGPAIFDNFRLERKGRGGALRLLAAWNRSGQREREFSRVLESRGNSVGCRGSLRLTNEKGLSQAEAA